MPMKMMHGGVEVPTVTPKDFTDLRDVNFTNAQDGDVPTYDSATGKLVNKPAHGVFELWQNPNERVAFAGGSIDPIDSDIEYDAIWVEVGFYMGESYCPQIFTLGKGITGARTIRMVNWGGENANEYIKMYRYFRSFEQSYNSTTKKYTFTFGDCTVYTKVVNVNTAQTSSTNIAYLVPFRIYGVIHND